MSAAPAYDFANILFAGPCNRRCPWCIGEQLPGSVNRNNLDEFPPRGLDALVDEVNRWGVRDVVLTGTVTDPQLYAHERALIDLLRARLHEGARLSLHTNGALALRKLDAFNAYDRATLSIPSLCSATYSRMMGATHVPDLAAIVRAATIPVKVSCVLDAPNVTELDDFLACCADMGVRRVVLRRLFGETRRWQILPGRQPVAWFKGNPVFEVLGMEVSYQDFHDATFRSLNLFADGTLGRSYRLTETTELGLGADVVTARAERSGGSRPGAQSHSPPVPRS